MCFHRGLWWLVVSSLVLAMGAGVYAGYGDPGFLGPYLLLVGELFAVCYVLRSVEKGNWLGHLSVIAIAICGTFVVLVSVSTCSGCAFAADGSCTPMHYWSALKEMVGILVISTVLVVIGGAAFWFRVLLGSREN